MHKRCSSIRGKLKHNSKFKCQRPGITKECPGIELKGQSLQIVEKLSYFGDTKGAKVGACDGVITSSRSGWYKFRDLVSLLASRGLPA